MTAKAGDPKLENLSSDLLKTLAHHDAEIASFGGRITVVENAVSNLSDTVQKGFAGILERLSTMDSKRGPGFGAVLGWIAMGGGVISMSAAAITVLVTSFVSPPITRLEEKVVRLSHYVDRREEVDRQDYIELRRLRDRAVSDDILRIEKQLRQIEQRAAAGLRPSATP